MIEIKYENGSMEIDPTAFCKSGNITAFRKLTMLANDSDIIYQTVAIDCFRCAFEDELENIKLEVAAEAALYQIKVEELEAKYDPSYPPLEKKLGGLKKLEQKKKSLRGKFTAAIKRLERRKVKIGKLKKILEE